MTKDVTATVELTVDTDITIEQVVTTLSLLLEDVEEAEGYYHAEVVNSVEKEKLPEEFREMFDDIDAQNLEQAKEFAERVLDDE